MRIFVLTLLIVSTYICSPPLHAQSPRPQAQEAEYSAENNPPAKEDNIFSRASNEQIDESQSFYKRCTENDTMNAKKDCKCAATAYLETRVKLGDSATTDQIMAENINTCLKDSSAATESNSDLSEITDEQLAEAEAMFQNCKSTLKLSRFFDCECYAAKFLDERIKQGPFASKEEIFTKFKNECRNIIDTTGEKYTYCMKRIMLRPPRNMEPKEFCECYARKWADLFKAYSGDINGQTKGIIAAQARAHCKRQKR